MSERRDRVNRPAAVAWRPCRCRRRCPSALDERLAVRVTPDARRQIAAGHPWVYDESITSISTGGRPATSR